MPPVENPSDPSGPLVRPRYEYEYDIYGNQVVVRDNVVQELDGTVDYDHDDNNPGNDYRETFFSYDQFGRQVARTLPLGVEAAFNGTFQETMEYDVAGRLARATDFEDRVTDYVYDDLGRLDEKQFFDAIDPPNDDPGQATNFDEITDYFYDALGRQTKVHQDLNHDGIENSGDRITENFFDELGRLTDVETDFDGNGTPDTYINYHYNNLGQLERTATGSDPVNNPTTATEYTYDRLGRLDKVTATDRDGSSITDETTIYEYDAVGNLEQVLRHGGVGTVYTYDTLNRLTDLINFYDDNSDGLYDPDDPATANDNDDGDPLISSFHYTLRDDGKREQSVETFPGLAPVGTFPLVQHYVWEYDNAGRLISETFDYGPGKENKPDPLYHADFLDQDYVDTFEYDLVGNRLEYKRIDLVVPTFVLFTTTYDYDENDRLLSESKDAYLLDDDRYVEYTYNVTQQTGKNVYKEVVTQSGTIDEIVVNSYNLQGRLEEVDIDPDGAAGSAAHVITNYEYDDNGFRVKKDVDGTVTRYLADANNHTGYTQVLEELDSAGNVQTTFLLGHDVLAQHDATHGQVYLVADGHGSTRQLIDTSGSIVTPTSGPAQFFTYTAYGEAHGFDVSEAETDILYTGEWYENSTGWQYNRERFYDPSTGRWSRRDPILGSLSDPISLHKYLYANGDPVNGIDPSGLFALAGISAASAIGTTLNTLTAQAGQAVAGTLGYDIPVDPLDLLLFGGDLGIIPESISDTFSSFGEFISEHADRLGFGAGMSIIGAVLAKPSLLNQLRSHSSRVSQLIGLAPNLPAQLKLPTNIQRLILNDALGAAGTGRIAHHIIPLEALSKHRTLFEKAAKAGFDLNGRRNGILLKEGLEHVGRHPQYNDDVLEAVRQISLNLSPRDTAREIQNIAEVLRAAFCR